MNQGYVYATSWSNLIRNLSQRESISRHLFNQSVEFQIMHESNKSVRAARSQLTCCTSKHVN